MLLLVVNPPHPLLKRGEERDGFLPVPSGSDGYSHTIPFGEFLLFLEP